MAISRWLGGNSLISSPSSTMRPSVGNSKPAIRRSVVVLPQPDGPSSVTKLALFDVDVHVVDRDDVAATRFADEDFAEVVQYEEQRVSPISVRDAAIGARYRAWLDAAGQPRAYPPPMLRSMASRLRNVRPSHRYIRPMAARTIKIRITE